MAEKARRKSANSKNPPVYQGGDQSYSMWRKELSFWCEFTELEKSEQGFAILFRLENEEAKEAVMRLEMEDLKCDEGVENILEILDGLYLKDKKTSMYESYVAFEDYRRPAGTNISEFINEFERRLNKTKEYEVEMSENLLAFRLLKCCNLSKSKEQLARATISKWDYSEMKTHLKQTFGDHNIDDHREFQEINQVENENLSEEQALYTRYRPPRGKSNFRGNPRGNFQNRSPNYRGRYQNNTRGNYQYQNNSKASNNRGKNRGTNPIDQYGRISTCANCGSRNHWAQDCPDPNENQVFEINTLELFQSDYDQPGKLKQLVSDTFDAAVLDTAATKTAAGKIWINEYIRKLNNEEKLKIKERPSNSTYRFGDGEKVTALYATSIPATIGSKKVLIDVDVLDKDIPCLLSRPSMEKTNTNIDLKHQEVTMLDQKIPMFISSSGHYCIPLTPEKRVICQDNSHATLVFNNPNKTKKQIAEKLHSSFSHPSAYKLTALVKSSGYSNDKELIKEIHKISNDCSICKEFRRPPRRPVVGLPLATNFNECLQLDIKFIENKPILHMIDHATRLSSCTLMNSKSAEEVFKGLMTFWLALYGSPQKMMSDNGGEFSNHLIRELSEKFDITVHTTAAESPWANGLTERHNRTLGEMIRKTMRETNCSLPIAIAWCTNAKNSLQNVNGYSPYQLVYGRNPNLPDIFNCKPTSYSDSTESKLIAEVLSAKKAAREAFIKAESDEKLKRALQHNIRSSNNVKFVTGDKVYYYRNNSHQWKGPATVLGQDGQSVLLNHGGYLIRCHPCRLSLIGNSPTICKPKTTFPSNPLKSTNNPSSDDSYESEENNSDDELKIPAEVSNHIEQDISDDNDEEYQESDAEQVSENELSPFDILQEELSNLINEKEELPNVTNEIHDNQNETKSNEITQNIDKQNIEDLHEILITDLQNIKIGMIIKCTLKDKPKNEYTVKIISRSGKAKGKYKHEYNAINQENGERIIIDFERQATNIYQIIKITYNNEKNELTTKGLEDEMAHKSTEYSEEIINIATNTAEMKNTAKTAELASWREHDVYEEIQDTGQPCITTRWVLKEKQKPNKEIFIKARLCARGFEEDKSEIRSDSPTASKETIRFALTIASSLSWTIQSLDVKTAFLQSFEITRDVFIRPPIEANTQGVWRLKKPVYGLSDSSRLWYLTIRKRLTDIGMSVSTHDQGLFYQHIDNNICTILILFVDDILLTAPQLIIEDQVKNIKDMFLIGSENTESFRYLGMNITQKADLTISLERFSYIQSIKCIPEDILTNKIKLNPIPSTLRKPLRSAIGRLNWVTTTSRPDISCETRVLSTVINSAIYEDLHKVNKIIKYLKNEDVSLTFPKLSSIKEIEIAVFADASLGNLRGGASQAGFIILLTDTRLCTPLMWNSYKLKRVVNNTLAAETLSVNEALDYAFFYAKSYGKVLYNQNVTIPITCITDSKSLYNASQTTHQIDQKRLLIEISIIREMIEKKEMKLKWIETKFQLANSLTKIGASNKLLNQVISTGVLPKEITQVLKQ